MRGVRGFVGTEREGVSALEAATLENIRREDMAANNGVQGKERWFPQNRASKTLWSAPRSPSNASTLQVSQCPA